MTECLMAHKDDKSYMVTDIFEINAVGSCQMEMPSEVFECYKFSKHVVA